MGQKSDLTSEEKFAIVAELGKRRTTLEISKMLEREHRTLKKSVQSCPPTRSRSDKGVSRVISKRSMSRLKREVVKNPGLTIGNVFKRIGSEDISKFTRCRLLNKLRKNEKPVTRPPQKPINKQNRVKWAPDYMKTGFSTVVFTDECRDVVGPFKVPDGIKITCIHYVTFLEVNFIPWFKTKKFSFKRNLIFRQDNLPSHVAKNSLQYLQKIGFSGHHLMKWPVYSPDLTPIENL